MNLIIQKNSISYEVVQLEQAKLLSILESFRSSKQKKLLTAINNCPGLLTHYLSKAFYYNNIPDTICSINKKLISYGLTIHCIEPESKPDNKSHNWFLCKSKPLIG